MLQQIKKFTHETGAFAIDSRSLSRLAEILAWKTGCNDVRVRRQLTNGLNIRYQLDSGESIAKDFLGSGIDFT